MNERLFRPGILGHLDHIPGHFGPGIRTPDRPITIKVYVCEYYCTRHAEHYGYTACVTVTSKQDTNHGILIAVNTEIDFLTKMY